MPSRWLKVWELDSSSPAMAPYGESDSVNKVRIEQLHDLVSGLSHEEDEEDRPSEYSLNTFNQLIRETCERLNGTIPRPVIIPDSEHGIRIAWKVGEQEVRVVVPESQNRRAYIYFRRGNHSEIDETLSANILAARLEAIA